MSKVNICNVYNHVGVNNCNCKHM